MSPEGWTRNLRCGGAVQDLVQLPDETKVNKDWGEELGGFIKEVLRRRVRAPRWGGEDTEGDLREQAAEVDEVARDNGVQLERGVEQEELDQVPMERQTALETSRDLSVPLAAKGRDGSLSRNSLQLDVDQVGDAAGQDHVGGESLGGQDLLQTGDQLDLNLTPGEPALDVPPVQPDPVVTVNEDPAGEEVLLQDQSLRRDGGAQQAGEEEDGGAQQGGEEAHVSEFSLLVGCPSFTCEFVLSVGVNIVLFYAVNLGLVFLTSAPCRCNYFFSLFKHSIDTFSNIPLTGLNSRL